ncbi:hypothetical protein [Parasutterella sp.]|uniref:hypothetical protein n=1 Tax=Parasutterella sp. TaxID=2049037 RepID=UPI0035228491
MDINWSRYIEIARAQDLGSAEVARLIRTETRRKVNISEVKRRLSISDPSAAQSRQDNSLDVINLCESEADEESTLSISAEGMTFEFKTQRPEESVIFILSRMRGDVI